MQQGVESGALDNMLPGRCPDQVYLTPEHMSRDQYVGMDSGRVHAS